MKRFAVYLFDFYIKVKIISQISQQRAAIEDIRLHNIILLANILPEHVSEKFLTEPDSKVCKICISNHYHIIVVI